MPVHFSIGKTTRETSYPVYGTLFTAWPEGGGTEMNTIIFIFFGREGKGEGGGSRTPVGGSVTVTK